MEAPTLPDGLSQALKGVREGLHLRWNPIATLVKPGVFGADGKLQKKPVYDGRFELWDNADNNHPDYMVMRIQWPDGRYREPDFWLIDLLNQLNPANYNGDVGKMLTAIVDQPNAEISRICESDLDDLCEMAAKWYYYADQPKTRVLSNIN